MRSCKWHPWRSCSGWVPQSARGRGCLRDASGGRGPGGLSGAGCAPAGWLWCCCLAPAQEYVVHAPGLQEYSGPSHTHESKHETPQGCTPSVPVRVRLWLRMTPPGADARARLGGQEPCRDSCRDSCRESSLGRVGGGGRVVNKQGQVRTEGTNRVESRLG